MSMPESVRQKAKRLRASEEGFVYSYMIVADSVV